MRSEAQTNKTLELYAYLKDAQAELLQELANCSVEDKEMILTEMAMWCLKTIPGRNMPSHVKSKIIRSFFRRFYKEK